MMTNISFILSSNILIWLFFRPRTCTLPGRVWAVSSPAQESDGFELPRITHLNTCQFVSWVLRSTPPPPMPQDLDIAQPWTQQHPALQQESPRYPEARKCEDELRNDEPNCVSVWTRILRASFRLHQSQSSESRGSSSLIHRNYKTEGKERSGLTLASADDWLRMV